MSRLKNAPFRTLFTATAYLLFYTLLSCLFASSDVGKILVPILLALAAIVVGRRCGTSPVALFALRRASPALCAVAALCGVAACCLISSAACLLPPEIVPIAAEATRITPLAFALTAIVTPITEEAFYRGILFSVLEKDLAPTQCLVLTALTFGAMHRPAFVAAYAALCGVIMGYMRARTRSTLPSLAFHVGFNVCGFFPPKSDFAEYAAISALVLAAVIFAVVAMTKKKAKHDASPQSADLPSIKKSARKPKSQSRSAQHGRQ